MLAYDECYLNSMIQKTRYLFKLIARNAEADLRKPGYPYRR